MTTFTLVYVALSLGIPAFTVAFCLVGQKLSV